MSVMYGRNTGFRKIFFLQPIAADQFTNLPQRFPLHRCVVHEFFHNRVVFHCLFLSVVRYAGFQVACPGLFGIFLHDKRLLVVNNDD